MVLYMFIFWIWIFAVQIFAVRIFAVRFVGLVLPVYIVVLVHKGLMLPPYGNFHYICLRPFVYPLCLFYIHLVLYTFACVFMYAQGIYYKIFYNNVQLLFFILIRLNPLRLNPQKKGDIPPLFAHVLIF